MESKCGNCMFWKNSGHPQSAANPNPFGECHRHAPSPSFAPPDPEAGFIVGWPETSCGSWCGEYISRDAYVTTK